MFLYFSFQPQQTEPVDLSMNKKSSCPEFLQDGHMSGVPHPLDIRMGLSSLYYPKTGEVIIGCKSLPQWACEVRNRKLCYQGFFQQFWENAPGQNWEK